MATAHRTQQERSARTRALLLDATVDCLVELGYTRTTVAEICQRAGLSRGAQQHHFTTKAELMTSALEHLFTRLAERILATELPAGPGRLEKGVDLLWEAYSGTMSTAAVELWVAARTDEELRRSLLPVDRALGHATLEFYRQLVGDDGRDAAELETVLLLTVNLFRGLALDAMIGGDPTRRATLLTEWKALVLGRRLARPSLG
ncbi:MAG TPA: TetR/AcrR family transcriptional regulator, partial [Actinophytocola sp.]|nr:TetR/AcrR family transcriptional regulator [Actinophytocola sp.]